MKRPSLPRVVATCTAADALPGRTAGYRLRPLHRERVDFLGGDVAGKHRRTIRRDGNLSTILHRVLHPMKVFQSGDSFHLVVGGSKALHLLIGAAGRKVEIFSIWRQT